MLKNIGKSGVGIFGGGVGLHIKYRQRRLFVCGGFLHARCCEKMLNR